MQQRELSSTLMYSLADHSLVDHPSSLPMAFRREDTLFPMEAARRQRMFLTSPAVASS